jgi:enamine deaminase RidA (YjgF/YER057c/UK114 family)
MRTSPESKPAWYYSRRDLQEDAVAAKIRYLNPEALKKSPSYTHVVEVSSPVRTVYIAGQLGAGRDGGLVGAPGDFRAQAVQVFDNLKAALASVGAGFGDVVKLNSYLADIGHIAILREVRGGYLNAEKLPASTTIEVSKFALPGALLEVEAVAVLPLKAARAKAQAARGTRAAKLKAGLRKRK